MNTLEIKGGLYEMISEVKDRTLLLKLKHVVAEVIDQDNKVDFWDELTAEQQEELEAALQESEQEENLVDHQVVIDKYQQWKKKRRIRPSFNSRCAAIGTPPTG